MAKVKQTGEMASVLAFERKLSFSDGYMYSTAWDKRETEYTPIEIREKAVRGTISHSLPETTVGDPLKMREVVEVANLQIVDSATLEPDHDTLKLVYTLKVLPGIKNPSACNSTIHKKRIEGIITQYIKEFKFDELAKRYASNIATARGLWRNRIGSERIETHVSIVGTDKEWEFDSLKLSLNNFKENFLEVEELAEVISKALSGEKAVLLRVTTYSQIGNGQEVYPSQELVLDKDDSFQKGKNENIGNKSKILYSVNGIAALHSQKIGNAVRTIDTWYPDFEENERRPIAIEIYGTVTNLLEVHRVGKAKKDFYTLFNIWTSTGDLEEDDDKHYVMAVLVRGGVFGQKKDKKDKV